MKISKKFISIVLIIIIAVCSSSSALASQTSNDEIRFNNNRTFRIMHITDTHLSAKNVDDSAWLIGKACDKEIPDIVVITGDTAMNPTAEETFRISDILLNIFQSRNIPVAITFGNHDSESGVVSREELMAHYIDNFPCVVAVDDGESLTGCGTYNIPVLASDGDKIKFNLWIFDSGDYDSEHRYANVAEDQVEWYKETSSALENECGEKIYSIAFQHIIVPEVYNALEEVDKKSAFSFSHMYDNGKYYRFNPENVNYGMLNETPCCGYINHGQFDAMVERGDVLAICTGHDHTNAFGVKYKGIDITNSLSTRYNGDAFSSQYGYRMIEINENNTSDYSTKVVHWYDFFEKGDISELRKANDNFKLALKINFLGFFERVFKQVLVGVVEFFTGRTVRYPDM